MKISAPTKCCMGKTTAPIVYAPQSKGTSITSRNTGIKAILETVILFGKFTTIPPSYVKRLFIEKKSSQ
jgi:hypothetical protein